MELVCTGGVLEDGRFIRLYPIDYRYKPYAEWYRKYQWIEIEIEKNAKDPRPESFRQTHGTRITVLGQPLPAGGSWAERRRYVLARGVSTMCDLQTDSQKVRSLGIIKPRKVRDLVVENVAGEWPEKWKTLFQQQDLFGPDRKPLEKVPYKFSYVYDCESPTCRGHKMMIEDWEVGQLYRAMRDKYESESIAVDKVKQKLLDQMCAPDRDTYFYTGTVLKHDTWILLGVFWPKHIK